MPNLWKRAVIKLISKPGKSISSEPSTFRPIALTSVVGKIFTSILKDYLFEHLISNGYMLTSIQKGFVDNVNGCQEHQYKLVSAIKDAKVHQKSQAVLWLDLRNAFGSVDHNLIQFALRHYHCDGMLVRLVEHLYEDLRAMVATDQWRTREFVYGVGVFQGDPLSVAIFDMVMNLFVDALEPLESRCAYDFSSLNVSLFNSIFADDAATVTRGVKEAQLVCQRIGEFLEWSGLQANVSKCSCFSRRRQPGPAVFDPELSIKSQSIPFLSDKKSYRYLGLPISSDLHCDDIKAELLNKVHQLFAQVDKTAVSRFSKCQLYKKAILPKLAWLLSISSLPLHWIQSHLDTVVTRYLKKWVGLAHSAAVSRLFLDTNRGGLHLPQPSVFFQSLQCSCLLRFTKSNDICLQALANAKVGVEAQSSSSQFWPGAFLADHSLLAGPLKRNVKSIKKLTSELSYQNHFCHLSSLKVQGASARVEAVEDAQWAFSVECLPDRLFKWSINAVQDTLPTALNLCLWKKSVSNQCSLCHQTLPQSLCHVLNACPKLLRLGLYKERHDKVLSLFYSFIRSNVSSGYHVIADLPSLHYLFPHEIALTDLRPDIVVYNSKTRKCWLVELSVPFETVADDTRARKQQRYHDLVVETKASYHTELLQLVVGSRGFIFSETTRSLARICKPLKKDLETLYHDIVRTTIESSYRCWLNRKP